MTDLTKELDELRRLKPSDEIDAEFVSTILSAARAGDLIPKADALLAVALMVERAMDVADDFHKRALEWAKGVRGLEKHIGETDSSRIRDTISSLVPASALVDLKALRDELAEARNAHDVDQKAYLSAWNRAEAAEVKRVASEKVAAGLTVALEAADAELATLRAQVERLTVALSVAQRSLKPFADRVFNDNGDCTISDTHTLTPPDYWNAKNAERISRAALTEGAAP